MASHIVPYFVSHHGIQHPQAIGFGIKRSDPLGVINDVISFARTNLNVDALVNYRNGVNVAAQIRKPGYLVKYRLRFCRLSGPTASRDQAVIGLVLKTGTADV